MKKIVFLLSFCFICQNAYALSFWGNSYSPSLLNGLTNNLLYPRRQNLWNSYPHGYFNNPYRYQNNLNNRFNPRFNRFRGNMTGYSVPIVNPNLQNCSTNSYYVNQNGVVECNHDVDGSVSVKIIKDDD